MLLCICWARAHSMTICPGKCVCVCLGVCWEERETLRGMKSMCTVRFCLCMRKWYQRSKELGGRMCSCDCGLLVGVRVGCRVKNKIGHLWLYAHARVCVCVCVCSVHLCVIQLSRQASLILQLLVSEFPWKLLHNRLAVLAPAVSNRFLYCLEIHRQHFI